MTNTKATQPDVVEEVEELLARPDKHSDPFLAFRLLRRLVGEVKRQEERWNTRFNVLCGNCGKRYRGPRDEYLHGLGICGGSCHA